MAISLGTYFGRIVRPLRAYTRSTLVRTLIFAACCLVVYTIYAGTRSDIDSVMSVGGKVSRVAQFMLTYEDAPPPKVIHRPFDLDKPKRVMLLGYQRCGSTFAGNIFNQNPQAFYLFEPGDGVYGAMYGSRPGFNVPSDIFNYWNGSERIIPDIEAEGVADVLSSVLSCDFEQVPTELLIHRFFYLFMAQHKYLNSYVQCLRQHNLNIPNCGKKLKAVCPERFGEDPSKADYCRRHLWDVDSRGLRLRDEQNLENQQVFDGYAECMAKQRATLEQNCMPELVSKCDAAKLVTSKTVRVTMTSAEHMFHQLSNFRVIHLIRDPRAVVLSRLGDPTYHGMFSGRSLVREATLYCRGVLRDVMIRKRIEQRFPGSVLQVIYEHLVTNPLTQVKAIYSFLNEDMSPEVEDWLVNNTAGAVKNSTMIAEKWQEKMTFKMARSINEACVDLFDAIEYNWPQAT